MVVERGTAYSPSLVERGANRTSVCATLAPLFARPLHLCLRNNHDSCYVSMALPSLSNIKGACVSGLCCVSRRRPFLLPVGDVAGTPLSYFSQVRWWVYNTQNDLYCTT
jgi:hypothetical protein